MCINLLFYILQTLQYMTKSLFIHFKLHYFNALQKKIRQSGSIKNAVQWRCIPPILIHSKHCFYDYRCENRKIMVKTTYNSKIVAASIKYRFANPWYTSMLQMRFLLNNRKGLWPVKSTTTTVFLASKYSCTNNKLQISLFHLQAVNHVTTTAVVWQCSVMTRKFFYYQIQ